MIVSKPKGNTVFSLSMFLIICYSLVGYTLYQYLSHEEQFWYQYGILIIITPIAISVSIKVARTFKIVNLGKGQMTVKYPILFKVRKYNLKQLEQWEETIIKTQGTVFKQLIMRFEKEKVGIANQENTEYDKIFEYLRKKHPSKKINNPN